MTKARTWLPYVSAGVAAALAHGRAVANGFVLDDATLLVNNPFLRGTGGLWPLVSRSFFAASAEPMAAPYYRPASGLLYWLSFHLLGVSAPAQHALNVAMHAAVACLLVAVLLRHGASRLTAAALGVLFAVHPASVEIVSYIGGRQEMLGWLVVLGALLALEGASPRRTAIITAVAAASACFAHESFLWSLVLLPLAAWLGEADAERSRARGRAAAVGAVVAGAAVLLARNLAHTPGFSAPGVSLGAWLGALAAVVQRLLGDAIAPTDLAVDVTAKPLAFGPSLPWLLGLLLAIGLSVRVARRAGRGPATVLLVAGIVMMTSTFVLHTPLAVRFGSIADRYAYPVLVGLAFVGAAAASLAPAPTIDAQLVGLLRVVPFALAAALIPMSWSRVVSWKEEGSLQHQMFIDRPGDPQSRLAEGMRLLTAGDLEAAYPHCRAYADAFPESDRADLCIGGWLVIHGRAQEALSPLSRYAEDHPSLSSARRALLLAAFMAGDLDKVSRTLDAWGPALADQPEVVEARAELARRQGRAP